MHGSQKGKDTNKKFNEWLKKRGYEVIGKEFPDGVLSGGWPDFIVRNPKGKIEFFEVKSGKHRLDPHQKEVLKILKRIGKVHVMRLNDETDEFVPERISF